MRLHLPTPLRWSDLDAYGHVNNVQMLRLLEEARVRTFWANQGPEAVAAGGESMPSAVIEGGPAANTLSFLARQAIEYLVPLPYLREPIDIQLWISALGGASLDLCYEVHSPAGTEDVVYARAETTIVLVDATTERPRRITDEERTAWAPYLDDPVVMRRR